MSLDILLWKNGPMSFIVCVKTKKYISENRIIEKNRFIYSSGSKHKGGFEMQAR